MEGVEGVLGGGMGRVVWVLEVGEGGLEERGRVKVEVEVEVERSVSKDFFFRVMVRGAVLVMASLMWGGTRTQANDRSCVTQPPRISQARMSMYVGL